MNLPSGFQFLMCLTVISLLGIENEVSAQHELEGWKSVREISASEANQAAAAMGNELFAIGNRVIAKYDRNTGEKLAVSTGEAHHLNSGFVYQGKIYCAHSNFPRTPEESDIKVLDPETMELTQFHRFSQPPGSLTVVLQKDDEWWCIFAHYGANNSKTVLVRYDQKFNELARFHFPQSVISKLGKYSISGAIWQGETLLATGHDDPILFRLNLPSTGTELEDAGTAAVPFTGQGFATDSALGALIGINRKKKKLILAAPIRE